ncbi:MAG TPA: PKD domain-containing protein [Methanomassiliicoccales archaeon]|nr:PKD domain-containing protein [Methanomassiliicoccales archaeon]
MTFLGTGTNAVLPGYYLLTVSKPSVYSNVEYPSIVKFTGTGPVALNLVTLPATTGTLSFTITQAVGGANAANVVVKIYDVNSVSKLQRSIPTFTGTSSVNVFPGTYKVIVTAPDLEQEVGTFTVTASAITPVAFALNPAVAVTGFVYRDNVPATGVTAYLVSTNTALDVDMRIVQARTVGSNGFKFDAYAGNFNMIVDATDATANMTAQTILPASPVLFNRVNVSTATGQSDVSNVVFANNNWNTFNLTRTLNAGFDMPMANIAYGIPNIRMQIDFAFGNGDGTVTQAEVNAFTARAQSFGPVNATSDFMTKVNSTSFIVGSTDFSQFAFSGLTGSVSAKTPYVLSSRTQYNAQTTLGNGYNSYTVLGYCKYATPSMAFTTTLDWPNGYEMTSNTTQSTYVTVSGYLNVTISTTQRPTGVYEQVTMGIQKSVAPNAVGAVGVPSNTAYAVTGTSGQLLYYIVSTNKPIVFTGNGSSDPNGNPLKYSWNFVGVGAVGPIASAWTTFTFGAASFNITVVLTVTDVAGLTATNTFYIKADGINPVADFSVVNKTVSAGQLNLDQNSATVFNGGLSYDHIASNADVGVIKTYVWTWGDGNTTTVGVGQNVNVTKTYARPGTFNLVLNVTDVAGHYSLKSIVVKVADKTPPTISFFVSKSGSTASILTAQENQTLVLNANATYSQFEPFNSLNFTWNMGNGVVLYGNYVASTAQYPNGFYYTGINTYTIKLTVKDQLNNAANKTMSFTVTSQPRPDLRMISMSVSPTVLSEGETGTITVNLTNVGTLLAGTPTVEFFILSASGSKTSIGTSTDMTVNGTPATQLKPGEYGLITFKWTPDTKGNYTILGSASTVGEINKADNTDTLVVTVNEAAWKAVALYGGIFAVIIVVIVLFYMRKRLPKLGRKKKGEETVGKKPTEPQQKKK